MLSAIRRHRFVDLTMLFAQLDSEDRNLASSNHAPSHPTLPAIFQECSLPKCQIMQLVDLGDRFDVLADMLRAVMMYDRGRIDFPFSGRKCVGGFSGEI